MNRMPVLPGMFSDDPAPVAPSTVTMAPSAIEARQSGRVRAVGSITASMARYRDALIAHGPCTDQELEQRAGMPLSAINARRNDWHDADPNAVVAHDRVHQQWASGRVTTRVVWRWNGARP